MIESANEDFAVAGTTSRWVWRERTMLIEAFNMIFGQPTSQPADYYNGKATLVDTYEFERAHKLGTSIVYRRVISNRGELSVSSEPSRNVVPELLGSYTISCDHPVPGLHGSAGGLPEGFQLTVAEQPEEQQAFPFDAVWDSALQQGWWWITARTIAKLGHATLELILLVSVAPGQQTQHALDQVVGSLRLEGFDTDDILVELYNPRVARPASPWPHAFTIERRTRSSVAEHMASLGFNSPG